MIVFATYTSPNVVNIHFRIRAQIRICTRIHLHIQIDIHIRRSSRMKGALHRHQYLNLDPHPEAMHSSDSLTRPTAMTQRSEPPIEPEETG